MITDKNYPLPSNDAYVSLPKGHCKTVTLDGDFTVEELKQLIVMTEEALVDAEKELKAGGT